MDKVAVLMDHKSLKFFKTQSKLSCQQIEWMELLGNFNLNLTYHPGKELLQVNALLWLYIHNAQAKGDLDPDWPMLYAHNDKDM